MTRRAGVITLLLCLLGGFSLLHSPSAHAQSLNDWPIYQLNPQHTGYNSAETVLAPPLQLLWSQQLSGVTDLPGNLEVDNSTLFVQDTSGMLSAIDATSGTTKWQAQAKTQSSVAIANGLVFTFGTEFSPNNCSTDCLVTAKEEQTGRVIWSTLIGDLPFGNAAYAITTTDNIVFVSLSHDLLALDATTGAILWDTELADAIFTTPAVVNGKVYVGTYQNAFYALDETTGSILWQGSSACYFSGPVVVGNDVYVGNSCNGAIDIYDTSSGTLVGRTAATRSPVRAPISYANNTLYTQDVAGNVYAFDITTGQIRWTYNTGANGAFIQTPVAGANGVVYVGASDGEVPHD